MESLTGCMRVRNISLPSAQKQTVVTKSFFPQLLEEVFVSNGAIWWSTTGKRLAYAEFNDTEVHKVEFSWYGSEQYPETVAIPYAKVGL